jgi:non-ribosomal peptide synthetase component E (peptide arylation enzyme)
MGAAIATGVAALVMPLGLWWYSQRIHPHAYAYTRMSGYVVLMVGGAVLATHMADSISRTLICAAYVLLITVAERDALRHVVHRRTPPTS